MWSHAATLIKDLVSRESRWCPAAQRKLLATKLKYKRMLCHAPELPKGGGGALGGKRTPSSDT